MSQQRVLIDSQIFHLQRTGGISRYFAELMRCFVTEPTLGVDLVTPYRWVDNEHLSAVFPGRFTERRSWRDLQARLATNPRVARGGIIAPWWYDSDKRVALVHRTYYLPALNERLQRLPFVTTVHDMIPELLPEAFPQGNPHLAKRRQVMASAGVICVSQTTLADMTRAYGALDKPVAVIPHGVDAAFFLDNSRGPQSMYLLHVGSRAGYKDGITLLRAWPTLADRFPRLRLVLLGGGPLTGYEREVVSAGAGADRVHQVTPPDSGLPRLYGGASCLVVPSRYEGFGLPVLEAMAAGTPVVLTDTPGLREVASHGGLFFPPGEVDALSERVTRVLEDSRLRAGLVAGGRARASEFTWQRTAGRTAAFYREVLAG